ncbi:MAG: ornithine carbamoyltransferase [Coriobacteriales bacterium]|jgi:ornithine carbamoyltransferase|nr:ornithine carbamoyltransferase [Coriobacteriales bacterium]
MTNDTCDWARLDAAADSSLAGNPLAGRDLLRLLDLTPSELFFVLSVAMRQKAAWRLDPAAEAASAPYRGSTVAVILEKPSLRTRISFEVGAVRLGAHAAVMSDKQSAFSRGESIKDTVMVLERFADCIVLRTFEQARLAEVAHWASVPVINALTDDYHPCQGLADLLTMHEHKGDLSRLKVAFIGDGNNMAHTYAEAAALIGMELHLVTPLDFAPDPSIIDACRAQAADPRRIRVDEDREAALAGADVVITDTWTSMGKEDDVARRRAAFASYTVDAATMRKAAPGAMFLHCLPAHRGEEVTDEVMDGPQSAIYDEAENRLHVQKALMSLVMAATAGRGADTERSCPR